MDELSGYSGSFRFLGRSHDDFRSFNDMNSNSIMPEASTKRRTGDWSLKQQLMGVLYKKSSGQQSTKWSKRLFVVKDGWLLYYAENERRDLDRRATLNVHPKGVFPLGDCSISAMKENGHQFAFCVESSDIEGKLVLAAESDFEREKWLDVLQRSSRITWANAQLSERMIEQLEMHGLQMAKEKQDVFDRLQNELVALCDERNKSEELERLNKELEKEKLKLESFMEDVQLEHEHTKSELEETLDIMVNVDNERKQLSDILKTQKAELETLESERQKVLAQLTERDTYTEKLCKENANISQTSEDLQTTLQTTLQTIERKTENLREEKVVAEKKLLEREELAEQLEEERAHFSNHARELQDTIQNLIAQKEMTESELKEEIIARMDAERRLRQAELSLSRLDHTVQNETNNLEDKVVEEMMVDVHKLKNFFENMAAEAKIDADKPMMVKNAIHARKSIVRRVKTSKFEARRRSSVLRNRSSSLTHSDRQKRPSVPVRRALTTVLKPSERPATTGDAAKFIAIPEKLMEECETLV